MSLNVAITVSGLSEEQAKLTSLSKKLLDFSEAFKQIGPELDNYYAGQVFASQGGILGEVWAALAPATVKHKIAVWGSRAANTPLIASGAMQKSFVYEASSTALTISNSATYFQYHQSTEDRSRLPRRAMMGVNDDVKNIISQLIESDVKAKIESLI